MPAKGGPDELLPKREIPRDAWDAFDQTHLDSEGLPPGYLAPFSGHGATSPQSLVPRLAALGAWLSRVAGQPAAVWWAAGRGGLHPAVASQIRRALLKEKGASIQLIRAAWGLLFEAWEEAGAPGPVRSDWYELQAAIKVDGWSSGVIREFAALHAPRFTVSRPTLEAQRPPLAGKSLERHCLISVDVKYPEMDVGVAIPDDYLRDAVRSWRGLLERAVLLERVASPYLLEQFGSLVPNVHGNSRPQHLHDLAIPLLFYRDLMNRLVVLDAAAAREEVQSWWKDDDTVFTRLRLWACGKEALLSAEAVIQFFVQLTDRAFWSLHQSDLLLSMGERWANFAPASRDQLVSRLLFGPPPREDEATADFAERRAWAILERLEWLRQRGCDLGIDWEKETANLRAAAPRWRQEFATDAAESREVRSYSVRTDSAFNALLEVPRGNILARARELTGQRLELKEQKDPFAGLSGERPVRSLSALHLAPPDSPDLGWAWTTFLNVQSRINREGKDKADTGNRQHTLTRLVARRLSQLPQQRLIELLQPITDWLLTACERYSSEMQQPDTLWTKILAAQAAAPDAAGPVVPRRPREWATEALNSPAGKLAQALMTDPSKADADPGGGFDAGWLKRIEQLVDVPGNTRRHALAILAYNLNWFYTRDSEWTEAHMLTALKDPEDAQALWAGVLWAGAPPNATLYPRLKPALLNLERDASLDRNAHLEVLAGILLAGWARADAAGARLVSNDEMRTVLLNATDEFRSQLLWHIERERNHDPNSIARIAEFLRDAWPRQKTVKTPKASARLAELAFSSEPIFAAIAHLVIDRVSTSDRGHLMLFDFIENSDEIVRARPEEALELLSRVLPADVRQWPYKIEQVLDRIGAARPALLTDGRLLELRRRWNTR